MKGLLILIGLLISFTQLVAQVVYEPVANNMVYELLDELATQGVISINSVVKPYSRMFIAEKLKEAKEAGEGLNRRQREEVEFYLKDYTFELGVKSEELRVKSEALRVNSSLGINPVAFRYNSRVFKTSVEPWLGGRLMVNENGSFKEFIGGGEVFGYLGRHVGYYANANYSWQSEPLVDPVMFTQEEGKRWSYNGNGSVYNTEWRGGVSVGWKWGDVGIYKERPVWGYSRNSAMILSGKAPAFPFLQLHLKPAIWIEFNYLHGMIQNNIFDSNYTAAEYQTSANESQKKFLVANMITIKPWRFISLSIGNSIVYTSDFINPTFILPVQFFKSTDQSQGGIEVSNGQNNQLFFAFDLWLFKKLQLYFSTYIEDLKMKALWSSGEINELGWQGGLVLQNYPIKNLSIGCQYTRTNPLTYNHWVAPTNFYMNNFCMGNYMRDDSQEILFQLIYKPHYRLSVSGTYTWSVHGIDYRNIGTLNNYLLPYLGEITYRNNRVEFTVGYKITTGVIVEMQYIYQTVYGDKKFTPEVFRGKTNTIATTIKVNL